MLQLIAVIGLILIAAAVIVTAWLRLRARRPAPTKTGFWEYVRDPGSHRRSAESYVRKDQVAIQLAKEPPEVLVRMLLDNETLDVVKQAVCEAGTAIIPHLIAAVDDPQFRQPADEDTEESTDLLLQRSEPLETVLECLEQYVPESAVAQISRLVGDKNSEIRKRVALVLGTIASDEAAEPLRRSLSDDDAYVRSYAMMGILRGLEAQRGSVGFRKELFEAILPLVPRHDETTSGDAPRCLLRLDRQRAISALTTTEALMPGREGLQYVLRALRESNIAVDPATLLNLAESLEKGNLDYPNDYVLGEALQLLAVSASEKAQAAITRCLNSPSQRVREDAARALASGKGLADPYGRAFDRLDRNGWSCLTEPQRHVLAVRILIDQVNNGGFAQYFVNSSGNQWPIAVAGLRAVGARQDADLVQKAIDLFGPEGPSTDRDKRHRQLASVVKNDDEVFSPMEKVFYKDNVDREVLLLRYIIEHEADFR